MWFSASIAHPISQEFHLEFATACQTYPVSLCSLWWLPLVVCQKWSYHQSGAYAPSKTWTWKRIFLEPAKHVHIWRRQEILERQQVVEFELSGHFTYPKKDPENIRIIFDLVPTHDMIPDSAKLHGTFDEDGICKLMHCDVVLLKAPHSW